MKVQLEISNLIFNFCIENLNTKLTYLSKWTNLYPMWTNNLFLINYSCLGLKNTYLNNKSTMCTK